MLAKLVSAIVAAVILTAVVCTFPFLGSGILGHGKLLQVQQLLDFRTGTGALWGGGRALMP
jgi:hypothetical protein